MNLPPPPSGPGRPSSSGCVGGLIIAGSVIVSFVLLITSLRGNIDDEGLSLDPFGVVMAFVVFTGGIAFGVWTMSRRGQ